MWLPYSSVMYYWFKSISYYSHYYVDMFQFEGDDTNSGDNNTEDQRNKMCDTGGSGCRSMQVHPTDLLPMMIDRLIDFLVIN